LQTETKGKNIRSVLTDLSSVFPEFELSHDLVGYNLLRTRESSLVSIMDGKPESSEINFNAISLNISGVLAGCASYAVMNNANKAGARNLYARIDLVITKVSFRGLGTSRLLILVLMAYLLEKFGPHLYSISCLAAHPAIEHVLEKLGFSPEKSPDRNYTKEILDLSARDTGELFDWYRKEAENSLRLVKYHLRQQKNG